MSVWILKYYWKPSRRMWMNMIGYIMREQSDRLGWGGVRTFVPLGFVRVRILYMYISRNEIVISHAPPLACILWIWFLLYIHFVHTTHVIDVRQFRKKWCNWIDFDTHQRSHCISCCIWCFDTFGLETSLGHVISEMFEVTKVEEYEMNAVTLPYIRLWLTTRPRGFAGPTYI